MQSLFEYLADIVSVIVGLGLTRILQGVARMLEANNTVPTSAPAESSLTE